MASKSVNVEKGKQGFQPRAERGEPAVATLHTPVINQSDTVNTSSDGDYHEFFATHKVDGSDFSVVRWYTLTTGVDGRTDIEQGYTFGFADDDAETWDSRDPETISVGSRAEAESRLLELKRDVTPEALYAHDWMVSARH